MCVCANITCLKKDIYLKEELFVQEQRLFKKFLHLKLVVPHVCCCCIQI